MVEICLSTEHKFVWSYRWTLVCEKCGLSCELDDGYPNLYESWHPNLTEDELRVILKKNDAIEEQLEREEKQKARLEELIDSAI